MLSKWPNLHNVIQLQPGIRWGVDQHVGQGVLMVALLIWKTKVTWSSRPVMTPCSTENAPCRYPRLTLFMTSLAVRFDRSSANHRHTEELHCHGRSSDLADSTRVHPHRSRRWGGPGASSDCGPALKAPPSRSAGRGSGAAERCAGRGLWWSPGWSPATWCFSYSDAVPTACSSSSAEDDPTARCRGPPPPGLWCPRSHQRWLKPATAVLHKDFKDCIKDS